jgi:chaperonin GroES
MTPERFTPIPIRPIHNIVWLEHEDPPLRSPAGLWLPPPEDSATRPPVVARVVAVGPGRVLPSGDRVTPDVTVGQRVLVGAYEGVRTEFEGRAFHVVFDFAIHGLVEDEAAAS